MEKFSVLFHPCESLDDFLETTYTFRPLYTHHFFKPEDNSSALQFARYDIYYVVDTFELFIRVSGQLYMSKDETEIRKTLYTLYKSVFSSLPDYTLVLDEGVFKDILSARSAGTNKFIPPGRIIVEFPLDTSSIFQLRYCVFQEECSTPSSSHSSLENGRSHYKRTNSEDRNYHILTDKSFYFKHSYDKDYFDEDLYDQYYVNISHKGNFDNSLILNIIKSVNRIKKDKANSPRKSYSRLDFSIQENFNVLHRRLEWFYHWFIEGASNIKTDSRWVIFIPLIISTHRNLKEDDSSTSNFVSNLLTSNEYFKKSISNRFDNVSVESIRATIIQQPLGVVSDLVDLTSRPSPLARSMNGSSNQYSVTILGMVTAYYFFTLTNDRLRISQFMIFPNYNGRGFGLWVLEFIYRMAIMDSNVREITVEDPTSAFLVLRYVVALKLCFESNLIDPKILYGNEKNSPRIFKLFSKDSNNIPSRDHISSICKESKSYSSRLVDILQLANILPNPISSEFFQNRLSNKRQKTNNVDVKMSLFVQSDLYNDYCDKLKNKLKFEEMNSMVKSNTNKNLSPNKYLNSLDTFLDNMCNHTISGYIRVINKLRKIFPNT